METTEIVKLVLKAQAGCRESFGQLVTQFEPAVRAIALKRLKNHAEAAELVQDVLIQAYRKLDQLREPERFAGWLKRITVRLSINRIVRRPPELSQDPTTFGAVRGRSHSPIESILIAERATDVRQGLDRLKEIDRSTLLAFYFEGQSLIEMSDRFQSPIGTIKRRLHTARNRLREQLQIA